jgi:hypothetical protein
MLSEHKLNTLLCKRINNIYEFRTSIKGILENCSVLPWENRNPDSNLVKDKIYVYKF